MGEDSVFTYFTGKGYSKPKLLVKGHIRNGGARTETQELLDSACSLLVMPFAWHVLAGL